MMLIMMFVPTVKKKYGENLKKCKNKAHKKMARLLTLFLTNKGSGVMRLQEIQSMLNKKLGLGLKQQKGTGVLDKPLDAVKFAETLTKK